MINFQWLSSQEAKERLQTYWHNELKEKKSVSRDKILMRQVKGNAMVFFLLLAIIISFSVGKTTTWVVIGVIIVVIVLVWFFQEYKAETAINALKSMIEPLSTVIRDGKEMEIESKNLVPGDILILSMWDKISADAMIVEWHWLKINESMLTGESKEIEKKSISNQDNVSPSEHIIYMWTFVVNWHCVAEVIKTWMNTEFGKISSMISAAEKELPLQKKINNIVRYMAILAVIMAVLTGIVMLIQSPTLDKEHLIAILLLSIAMMVSAFPEWLPVVLISTLAKWAFRMSQKNALVNRMSIIETLWETTVICSDKTWTLTTWNMTVKKIFSDDQFYEVTWVWYQFKWSITQNNQKISPSKNSALYEIIQAAALCNNAQVRKTNTIDEYSVKWTPTEAALLVFAHKARVSQSIFDLLRIEEMAFNSDRKMMSVVIKEWSSYTTYSKWAPEILMQHCTHYQKNWETFKLDSNKKSDIQKKIDELTRRKYRVLCLAYKKTSQKESDLESNLILLWFVALEDSPREWVSEAIKICIDAWIKVKMITWDNKETAIEIWRDIGLIWLAMTGDEIEQLSDKELAEKIKDIVIFARVRPEHKIRIVKSLKDSWEIVTMTGDWVNDAPALKEAHIWVAMWRNWTDVSKEASDLILKDDNFVTIVAAIQEGRTIFKNIQKFVTYQLSVNFAEIWILFFAVLLWWPIPLVAIQILFMNLVTDNLPALTLGFTPSSPDIMKDKARKNSNILTSKLIIMLIIAWFVMIIGALSLYYIILNFTNVSIEAAHTIVLVTLILFEISNAFNFRSLTKPFYKLAFNNNPYLIYASIISILATIAIVYIPFLNKIFETSPISRYYRIIWFILSLSIIFIFDILKTKYKRLFTI